MLTNTDNTFTKIVIDFAPELSTDKKDFIDREMLETLGCDGIEDLSLSEAELNDLLGKEAVTGGPLPAEVLDVLELYADKRINKSSTYYFYGEKCFDLAQNAKKYLSQNFSTDSIQNISIDQCQEESWLEKWKEHYHPVEITSDFIVLPSWHDHEDTKYNGKKIIRIDPGQAFGTGSHESTKLCLSLIHQYFNTDKKIEIIDFGCGSGILALAHLLLNNSATSYFYDIDPAAYDNIEVNRVLNNIEVGRTILIPAGLELCAPWSNQKYDLVMANILLPILLDKASLLSQLVKPEGQLLISGIMVDQWNELFDKLSQFGKWEVVDKKELNSWMSVLVKKLS